MSRLAVPFVSGLLFAIGLAVAGMTIPAKIIGFLDIAGDWDPSLAFVMVGAIAVYAVAYRLSQGMRKPVAAPAFANLPPQRIDARLVVGALIFGAGWGLAGFCPGPALVSAATGLSQVLAFCAAMVLSFALTRIIDGRIQRRAARARPLR